MSWAPQYTLLTLPHNAGIAGVLCHGHLPAPELLRFTCQCSQPRSVRPLASRNAHKMTSQTAINKTFLLIGKQLFTFLVLSHRNSLSPIKCPSLFIYDAE